MRCLRDKSVLTYFYVPIPTKPLLRKLPHSNKGKSHCLSLKKAHSSAFFCGSGTFALDAYYSTHSPNFLKSSFCGRLIQILRIEKMLMYYCVHCAFFFLKSYYSPHISNFYKVRITGNSYIFLLTFCRNGISCLLLEIIFSIINLNKKNYET